VDSSPGKGSDFWFTAKFNVVTPPAKKPNSKRKAAKTNNNKILIVEDNVLNQHLTTSILGKEGYDADIAANGQEGVDLFMKKFYNVILMDIQMPVMDGIEATTLIRDYEAQNYDHKSIIIAITAHAKEGDQQRLKAAGLDYFLTKPFQPDMLLKIIRDHNKGGAAYSN
jgi:CheY-like chemotaxis protein